MTKEQALYGIIDRFCHDGDRQEDVFRFLQSVAGNDQIYRVSKWDDVAESEVHLQPGENISMKKECCPYLYHTGFGMIPAETPAIVYDEKIKSKVIKELDAIAENCLSAQECRTYGGLPFPADVKEEIDRLADAPREDYTVADYSHGSSSIKSYDIEKKLLRLEYKVLHCVSVTKKAFSDGSSNLQQKNQFIGGYALELDLSPEGDFGILRGPDGAGEAKIYIVPSPEEPNRILIGKGRREKSICVGELRWDRPDGKEGLQDFLKNPIYAMNSEGTVLSYLSSIMKDLARRNRILELDEAQTIEDRNALMKRDDFEFGKDYSHIYDAGILQPKAAKGPAKTLNSMPKENIFAKAYRDAVASGIDERLVQAMLAEVAQKVLGKAKTLAAKER